MTSFIKWIIGVILAITLTGFALYNRQSAEMIWSPVHPEIETPLYIIALSFMAAGFVLGSFYTWLNTAPLRREKRKQKREIKTLKREAQSAETSEDSTASNEPKNADQQQILLERSA